MLKSEFSCIAPYAGEEKTDGAGRVFKMRIIKARDYNDMSRKAANIISAQIIMKPDCVLGLATGSTPIGTYKQLVEWYKNCLLYTSLWREGTKNGTASAIMCIVKLNL